MHKVEKLKRTRHQCGPGVCIVEGRIDQYAVINQNIIVYERDSQKYFKIRKSDGKITFKTKKKEEIEKIFLQKR